MSAAYEAGVNFFDNAEAYAGGNAEIVMGNVLKKTKWPRESFVVSSKVFWGGEGPNDRGLSRKHIYEAGRRSLKRLQLDYLDLFFCHRPDPTTPIEETVRAMDDLVHQGLVLYWGTSEWSAADLMRAHGISESLALLHRKWSSHNTTCSTETGSRKNTCPCTGKSGWALRSGAR